MPSGYTADIGDGSIKDFRTFALRCARNFGACIMQRDDPMSDPPKVAEPSDYHLVNKNRAIAELEKLNAMSDEAAATEAQKEFDAKAAERNRVLKEKSEVEQRYKAMLAEVEAWEPPTPDHEGMKKFMRDQLNESIAWDCNTSYYTEPVLLTPQDWLAARRDNLNHDIEYHTKHYAEEVQRTNERGGWILDLYKSLEATPSP